MYVMNILFQAIFTLASPIGVGVLVSYLLTEYASAPGWIWAVLLIVGVFLGLYSMVKFILTAMNNLDKLEKEQEKRRIEEIKRKEKQAALRGENNNEGDGENNERNK